MNTRSALWGERWPAIALQSCVDKVEAAAPEDQARVKRELPCADFLGDGEPCLHAQRCLNAKRKELGPILYDREIMTKPRSQESTLFPFDLFAPMLNTGLAMVPHYRKTSGISQFQRVVSGWDLAWSEKVGGDYLVRTTAMVDLRTKKRRLLNIQRYPQGMTYTEQCKLIELDHNRFMEDLVVIETDAAQVIWAQTLEKSTDIPVFRHEAGADKADLAVGVPALLIDFDAERWEFPFMEHGLGYDEMLALLAEFEAFGWNDGKLEGVGEHDDMVMSFFHCWYGCKLVSMTLDEYRRETVPGRR